MPELEPAERLILAIDTSERAEAQRQVSIAKNAGARLVKLGLEISSATSWEYCSTLAADYDLDWVADAKLDDIPNTVAGAVKNIAGLDHPPFGITMHTNAGFESMKKAQEEAGDIIIFGVTELTSIPPEETMETYVIRADGRAIGMKREEVVAARARKAANAGLKGVVASPKEVGMIKSIPQTSSLFAMIPGTRSPGADSHDQSNVATPAAAIANGADTLVIGRQVTQAENPALAFAQIVAEIS